MQLFHTSAATSAVFDDPNLVSSAGLVPVVMLARSAGLQETDPGPVELDGGAMRMLVSRLDQQLGQVVRRHG
jgi:hypothetical protein